MFKCPINDVKGANTDRKESRGKPWELEPHKLRTYSNTTHPIRPREGAEFPKLRNPDSSAQRGERNDRHRGPGGVKTMIEGENSRCAQKAPNPLCKNHKNRNCSGDLVYSMSTVSQLWSENALTSRKSMEPHTENSSTFKTSNHLS